MNEQETPKSLKAIQEQCAELTRLLAEQEHLCGDSVNELTAIDDKAKTTEEYWNSKNFQAEGEKFAPILDKEAHLQALYSEAENTAYTLQCRLAEVLKSQAERMKVTEQFRVHFEELQATYRGLITSQQCLMNEQSGLHDKRWHHLHSHIEHLEKEREILAMRLSEYMATPDCPLNPIKALLLENTEIKATHSIKTAEIVAEFKVKLQEKQQLIETQRKRISAHVKQSLSAPTEPSFQHYETFASKKIEILEKTHEILETESQGLRSEIDKLRELAQIQAHTISELKTSNVSLETQLANFHSANVLQTKSVQQPTQQPELNIQLLIDKHTEIYHRWQATEKELAQTKHQWIEEVSQLHAYLENVRSSRDVNDVTQELLNSSQQNKRLLGKLRTLHKTFLNINKPSVKASIVNARLEQIHMLENEVVTYRKRLEELTQAFQTTQAQKEQAETQATETIEILNASIGELEVRNEELLNGHQELQTLLEKMLEEKEVMETHNQVGSEALRQLVTLLARALNN